MKSEFEMLGLLERYDGADDGISIKDLAAIYRIDVARSLVGQLLEKGYLAETKIQWAYCRTPDVDRDTIKYRLSEDGRDYLRMCRNVRQHNADEKSELQRNNAQSGRNSFKQSLIVGIISPVLTLVIEHWSAIVAFFKRFIVK